MVKESCCICLDEMNDDQYHKKLSCGHTLHFQCFKRLVFRKNLFIPCPICRTINTNIDKPSDDPETNIRLLCSSKVGSVRCLCKTKQGTVCKRRARLLNYGYCYQHNSKSVTNDMYPLLERYMYLILLQRNSWTTKLFLFDLGKQLIIKYSYKELGIDDILRCFYQYISIHDIFLIKDYDKMYDYYNLKKPSNEWIQYCSEKYMII